MLMVNSRLSKVITRRSLSQTYMPSVTFVVYAARIAFIHSYSINWKSCQNIRVQHKTSIR